MRYLFLFLMIFFSQGIFSSMPEISKMRDLFSKVDQDEKYNTQLGNITKNATLKSPVAYGYKALYYFMNSKYAFWPDTKLSNFNKGKTYLESAIKLSPNNAELRLIRYSVQYNVPSLLGYNKQLNEDRKILKLALYQSKYAEIKLLIGGVLKKYP